MKLCITISIVLSVLCSAHLVRVLQSGAVVQQVEMKDAADFLSRLKQERLRNLYQSATWTLSHDYRDFKHMEEVLTYVQHFMEALIAHQQGNSASLSKLGGLKGFKDQMAAWLNDNDQAVRAYAAIMLGICSDRAYAKQLGNLLARTDDRDELIQYDRGRAAMALGLVGAQEYTSRLVKLLTSKNEYDRVGAAYGLGFLTAKTQAPAIAKLLKDKDEDVREAAKESLEMIGAGDLKNRSKTPDSRPRQ